VPSCRRQAKVERVQIILNRSQPGLPRSSSSSSPVFGRTPNAGPESSGVVLTDVGTAQMTKEGMTDKQELLLSSTKYLKTIWISHPNVAMSFV